MESVDTVLVTGASGFLASHIVKQLLDLGYKVRGTVRSLKDERKVASLKKLSENSRYPLELYEANLTNEKGWAEAVKSCKYVIHTASPVPSYVPDDENECIRPAVNGVLNVFKACILDNSSVERIVFTSSVSAISGDDIKNSYLYTESDWGDTATSSPYSKSKILAEKAAWDFVDERKKANLPVFDLVSINPGLIIGPILNDTNFASMEPFKRLLEREVPMLPDISTPICDVRDVALAHIKALTDSDVVSKRIQITTANDAFSMKFCALVLEEEFGPKGYRIPTTLAPNFLIKILSIFNSTVKALLPFLGKKAKYSNERFLKLIDKQPIDCKKSIIDMSYSLIEKSYVKKRYKD